MQSFPMWPLLVAKGKKVLDTLKSKGALQVHVLSDRLVKAEAAHAIVNNPISGFRRADLMKNMILLADEIENFREDILIEVVRRLAVGNFEFLLQELKTPNDTVLDKLARFVDSLCIWRGSTDIPEFDAENPSLRPIAPRIMAKHSDPTSQDLADDDMKALMKLSKSESAPSTVAVTGGGADDAESGIVVKSEDELWEDCLD